MVSSLKGTLLLDSILRDIFLQVACETHTNGTHIFWEIYYIQVKVFDTRENLELALGTKRGHGWIPSSSLDLCVDYKGRSETVFVLDSTSNITFIE